MSGAYGEAVVAGRVQSTAGRLARLGFPDVEQALLACEQLGLAVDDPLLEAFARGADPALVLTGLRDLMDGLGTDERRDLRESLGVDEGLRDRLVAILGASVGLGRHLVRHPTDWRVLVDEAPALSAAALRRRLLGAVGASSDEPRPWGSGGATARDSSPATIDALRVAYTQTLMSIAARDLTGVVPVDEVAAELADLAAAALDAAQAVAAASLPPGSAPCRLAVIAMGKCGGRELNYVSDVDVVFVAAPLADGQPDEPGLRTATQLASGLMRVCSEVTGEGRLFTVDAALRPEGKAGPLVRTVESYLSYYRRWAQSWEVQALLKARPVAGDLALGERWRTELAPLVWTTDSRPDLPGEVQAMRRRVESLLPVGRAERELKLGPGGLRDVEFSVQLLQLVHGRSDATQRSGTTLEALAALRDGGYVAREDAEALDEAYRWLRTVEHRLQLQHLRRTHTMPADPAGLRWLARASGLPTAEALEDQHRRHATVVRRVHEKVFYRPLLSAVARLPSGDAGMDPEAVRARLDALGYTDPEAARRHLEAMTAGLSRRAAIQRQLLPAMLGWFADEVDPDAGLLAFRRVSEAVGDSPWYLRSLRDEGLVADRLAHLLARSSYVAGLLERAPEGIRLLGDDDALRPRERPALLAELLAAVRRTDQPDRAVRVARGLRRQELLRIATGDLLWLTGRGQVRQALTDVAAATVGAALDVALRHVRLRGRGALPARVALIGMGRLGGAEMGYASDADVIVVHERIGDASEEQAAAAAYAVVEEARRLLAVPAADPPLTLDAGLRPEGRQGPLSLSLAAYARYHESRGLLWERQALLKASPVAGDLDLAERFLDQIADLRWPTGTTPEQEAEVWRLRERMAAERAAPGLPASQRWRDVKLGPGGLADVEWVAQVLALRHAHEVPALRATGTLDVLAAAVRAGALDPTLAAVLQHGWEGAAAMRDAIVLVTDRHVDVLPGDGRALEGVSRVAGADLVRSWSEQSRLIREAALSVLA